MIKININPSKHKRGFQVVFLSVILHTNIKREYIVLKSIKPSTKVISKSFPAGASLMLLRTEEENAIPPVKARTTEEKIPRIAIYSFCELSNFFLTSLKLLSIFFMFLSASEKLSKRFLISSLFEFR